MIDVEKLKNVKRLVTHSNCPDGIASALIVKDALPDVEVLFVKHGTEQHRTLEPRPGTLFCDFSPWCSDERAVGGKEFLIKQWINTGTLVLDHHPTQREVTMKFVEAGLGAYGENDRGECGAWLAYEHVWLPLRGRDDDGEFEKAFPGRAHSYLIREFAKLAGVRDTWKKDDPRWQAACEQAEALMFWGFGEFSLSDFMSDSLLELGKKLFEKKLEHARTAIGEAHEFTTQKGTGVVLFQGVTPTSDAAEILEKDWDPIYRTGILDFPPNIVAGFHYRVDGGRLQLQFSTRSHTGYDVGAFCKSKGGGGHSAAAGFTVEQSAEIGANPYSVFKLLLEEWEQGQ